MVKKQRFEEAARLRDKEKRLIEDLEVAQRDWEKESEEIVFDVQEDDVASVIAMMSGVPVNKISQNEGQKLLNMKDQLKGKVIDAVEKGYKLGDKIIRYPKVVIGQS